VEFFLSSIGAVSHIFGQILLKLAGNVKVVKVEFHFFKNLIQKKIFVPKIFNFFVTVHDFLIKG
jgi:hypothetical protein